MPNKNGDTDSVTNDDTPLSGKECRCCRERILKNSDKDVIFVSIGATRDGIPSRGGRAAT